MTMSIGLEEVVSGRAMLPPLRNTRPAHWSTDPNAATGLPAKFVLGRNDGIRVGQTIGNGGFDLDRVPCGGAVHACCSHDRGGTQLGTDIYINGAGTVLPTTRIGNSSRAMTVWIDSATGAFNPMSTIPGTPTLNIVEWGRP